ncbi:DUF1127 domain-containing protein [Rhodopila sp.]|jgi:uncharacterized protein YjiS (DUF1127 family)|uniref:DUF1127 domain-containing protein n=1 Tax=Rhodopila sp. TaxID=2480087 RepID=UPI002B9753F0|nr:DUF1127 domain-containing protein [Rhodopila sp.]HVZ06954.1 DUF1127 domain-containing protein [Rhodopila sp.]
MFQSLGAALGTAPRARSSVTTWSGLAAAIRLAIRTQTTRQALPELSDHLLADIGISKAAALAEAERQPWDLMPIRYR